MTKVIHRVHYVVLGVVPILHDDYVLIVVIGVLTSVVAVKCDRMQLRHDLSGKERHVETVEDHFEVVFLFEDRQCEVVKSFGLVDQVEGHKVITCTHVLILNHLGAVDETSDQVRWSRQGEQVPESWQRVTE